MNYDHYEFRMVAPYTVYAARGTHIDAKRNEHPEMQPGYANLLAARSAAVELHRKPVEGEA